MKVAVTGASGLLGQALCKALEARGDHVVRLCHGDDWRWQVPDGHRSWVNTELLAGADALVHLAGESLAEGRWSAQKKKAILDSRVEGTKLMAEALAGLPDDQRPSTMLAISAIGYYGNRPGETLDETATPGQGFLADTCVQWEQAADAARQAQVRVVHPRLGLVLAKEGGALAKALPLFKMGGGGVLSHGDQIWSWISLNDVIRSFIFLLEHSQIQGPVNLVSPGAVTNRAFTATLGRILQRPTFVPVPAFALKLALGEMAEELILSSTHPLPTVLQQAGFEFSQPTLEQALRDLLDK